MFLSLDQRFAMHYPRHQSPTIQHVFSLTAPLCRPVLWHAQFLGILLYHAGIYIVTTAELARDRSLTLVKPYKQLPSLHRAHDLAISPTRIVVQRLVIFRDPEPWVVGNWRTRTLMLFTCVGFLGGFVLARSSGVPAQHPEPRYTVEIAIPEAANRSSISRHSGPLSYLRPHATPVANEAAIQRETVRLSDNESVIIPKQPSPVLAELPNSAESALRVAMTSGEPQDWALPDGRRGMVVVGSTYVRNREQCRDFSVFVLGEPVESGVRCGGLSALGSARKDNDDRIIFIAPPTTATAAAALQPLHKDSDN